MSNSRNGISLTSRGNLVSTCSVHIQSSQSFCHRNIQFEGLIIILPRCISATIVTIISWVTAAMKIPLGYVLHQNLGFFIIEILLGLFLYGMSF